MVPIALSCTSGTEHTLHPHRDWLRAPARETRIPMPRVISLLLSVLLLAGVGAGSATAQAPADHVVLISIDGLRPDFYIERTRPTPMLQYMAREGVHAQHVRVIFPSVTYPAHTTLVTGANPANHGILYNQPFEPDGQTGRWYWEYSYIQTETLWSAADRSGLVTASIGWPVTVGAPIDYNIPEVWSLDEPVGSVSVIREHTTPAGFLKTVEKEAVGRLTGNAFSGAHIEREDRVGAIAAYILREIRPALLTIHIVATDAYQHRHGREHHQVNRALAAADRAIARMYEASLDAGILDRTAFVISGDHGFADIDRRVAPNVWLTEAGLRDAADDRGDWRATFHATGGAAFLRLSDPDDLDAARMARKAIEDLPEVKRALFRFVERDELDRLGADPDAPFALAAAHHVGFSGAATGDAVQEATGGTHGHAPDFPGINTGFVAWGAGVQNGQVIPLMSLEDVAPVVAHLLGLDFVAKDGELVPGIVE
jgi:hypothetical protein